MTKAIHLLSYVLAGCIASTALSWLAGIHPALVRFAVGVYLLLGVFWVGLFIFDDALLKYFRLNLLEYRAVLVATMGAVAIGIGVGVVTCFQSI